MHQTNFSVFEDSIANLDDTNEVEKHLKISFSGDVW